MNAAERACNALEKDMMQRIATEYGEATLRSIRDLDAFFADVEVLDRKKPPSVYRTQAQQERWRQREMQKLLEKHKAESVVSRQLEEAGDAIALLIVLYKIGLFSETGNGTAQEINRQQKSFPVAERIQLPEPFPKATPPDLVHAKTSHRFTQQEREIEIILRDTQTPFSKVSIKNLKAAPALRRRLRNEMTQAVLKGESQQQLAKRIERVMQSGAYNARRIAQTERTRVQSQAAWDVMVQSEQLGVNMAKKWHARMVNTRDSHAALNGAIAPLHEPFHTIWGNSLMYPGDPSAPANEVINCHCGISPVVLRPGEVLQGRKKDDTISETSQKKSETDAVQYVGKINREMYKVITDDITTDEAVITDERIAHILERHPQEQHKAVIERLLESIQGPDYILKDTAPQTAVVLKAFPEQSERYRIIFRLHGKGDKSDYKNSVITAFYISERKYNKYIRNKEVLYKKE